MEEGTGDREYDLREVVARAQADPNGPSAMALKVHGLLAANNVTNWEAYCFAVEYIAAMSMIHFPHTGQEARQLIRYLYLTKYVRDEWRKTLALDEPMTVAATTSGPSGSSSNTSKE